MTSSSGPADRSNTPPRGELPASIRRSVALVWAIVALSVLNVLLTFVFLDELAAAAVRSGTPGLTEESARSSITFNGVFGLLFAVLWVMLGVLVRRGTGWARVALTVLAVIGIVFGLMALSLGVQRTEFVLIGVATLVLQAALVYFLWRRDSNSYLRSRRRPTS
jgi:hypothetical protein